MPALSPPNQSCRDRPPASKPRAQQQGSRGLHSPRPTMPRIHLKKKKKITKSKRDTHCRDKARARNQLDLGSGHTNTRMGSICSPSTRETRRGNQQIPYHSEKILARDFRNEDSGYKKYIASVYNI